MERVDIRRFNNDGINVDVFGELFFNNWNQSGKTAFISDDRICSSHFEGSSKITISAVDGFDLYYF